MLNKKNHITIGQTSINLAPRDPFYDSFIGKLTTWALSIGRYLVIFTELVVIVSFLSRFNLDRQVTDLNSEIVKQQRIIESYGELEQNVRNVQKQMDTYSQLKSQKPIKEVFDALTLITPDGIKYQELNIQQENILLHAHADSRQALDRFILNLQASTFFTEVVSENISNKDSKTQGYDFQISAKLASSKPTTSTRRRVTPAPEE